MRGICSDVCSQGLIQTRLWCWIFMRVDDFDLALHRSPVYSSSSKRVFAVEENKQLGILAWTCSSLDSFGGRFPPVCYFFCFICISRNCLFSRPLCVGGGRKGRDEGGMVALKMCRRFKFWCEITVTTRAQSVD